jgi:hypothetical protein
MRQSPSETPNEDLLPRRLFHDQSLISRRCKQTTVAQLLSAESLVPGGQLDERISEPLFREEPSTPRPSRSLLDIRLRVRARKPLSRDIVDVDFPAAAVPEIFLDIWDFARNVYGRTTCSAVPRS